MSVPIADELNIADRLRHSARLWSYAKAVIAPLGRDWLGRRAYVHRTFAQLDDDSERTARGLVRMGMPRGARIVLAVRPGIDFISLTFALFKAGAAIVLVDPGMGRANILKCLGEVRPDGFVAIPQVHVARLLKRRLFRNSRFHVTVGRRIPGGGPTLRDVMALGAEPVELPQMQRNDPAAIIFTSGSTGPPKGVLYEHGMFDAQVDLIRDQYGIEPGEVDLPGFPLFALFNCAMGVTTVVPDMDPTRPADVDPEKILEAIRDHGVTQAFGSPAFWNRIGRYCEAQSVTLPTLKRALSAGAPVPSHVLERMTKALVREGADLFTPYGATESLPACSIGARQILTETAAKTRLGAGTCVGRPFAGITVKVIAMVDGMIESFAEARELPAGEIGEIVVQGPSVTREYYLRPEATRLAKIPDGEQFWHRIGDVGYFDESGRLWFCGRKAHVVHTAHGPMFPVRCEAIFNEHPQIYRSALVGVGERGSQRPVIVAEPEEGTFPDSPQGAEQLKSELLELGSGHELTRTIETVLLHRSLPVDTRHNVKINREALAEWAASQQ